MRARRALVAFALATSVFVALPSAQNPQNAQNPGARLTSVAGEILVKFKPGVNANAKDNVHRAEGGRVLSEVARTGIQRVAVGVGNETAALARYRNNPNVLYAEPNTIRHIPKLTSHEAGSEVLPADHYFDEQWALHNTGQLFYCFVIFEPDEWCFYVGTPDADIDAPEAWAVSTGSPVIVATIDSGVDYTHPDIAPNYLGGFDFANGDSDPMDDHGHGTHVAGIIAAALNNSTGTPAEEEGVVGVAPNAKLLAYKVCLGTGECSDAAIIAAIAQAVTDGARVINMSLGDPAPSQALDDAVQDAWNAGLVIVAAAGNEGTDQTPFYPAAIDHVISVAAFDEDGRKADFTSFGNWVDISAPGNVIMSSVPLAECFLTNVPGDMGCYDWNTGTSMASPHVAGAAALVLSRSDVTTNQQVVDILQNSADPVGLVASAPLNSWTIHGGLNLHNAMSYGVATTNHNPSANAGSDQNVLDAGGDGTESVTLDGSASSDSDGTIASYEWSEGATVIGTGANPAVSLTVGAHTITLKVTDDDGADATDTVSVTIRPLVAPTANAGPDQTVSDAGGNGSESVTLNGSGSSDSDGSISSYEWSEGSTAIATGANPTVTLAVGTHTITLKVTDNDGATGTDTVSVTIKALVAPLANAGPDQTLTDDDDNGSESVTLNGSASSDADGTIVSYVWSEGATAVGSGVSPSVSLGVGTHTITLQVTDNDGVAATDIVVITINAPAPPQPATTSHIGDLDGSSAGNKNAWTALVTVAVHNTNHQPVSGAVVHGTWSGGGTGTSTCTTGAAGTCLIQSPSVKKSSSQTTFTITNVTTSGLTYTAAQNHDPETDSTGTAITVRKP